MHYISLKLNILSFWTGFLLNIGYVSNETNTDVHMYTWRIYSGRSACVAAQLESEILNGNYTGIYTITMDEKVSWSSINTLELIELQLYEKLSLGDQDMWNIIPLFASCLTPYSYYSNGISLWDFPATPMTSSIKIRSVSTQLVGCN